MRRYRIFILVVFTLVGIAVSVEAQIGKRVSIQAGTPEDKALAVINATADPAQKLALMDKFLAEYGKGDMAVVAYELYIAHYMVQKDYDKVFEYGEKLLGIDPENFPVSVNLVRAAQEKGDQARLFAAGERVAGLLARFQAQPAPEGTAAEVWQHEKAKALEDVRDNITYVQYALFNSAYQTQIGRAHV